MRSLLIVYGAARLLLSLRGLDIDVELAEQELLGGLGVLAQRLASGSFARGALPAKVPMLLLRADPLRVLSRSLPWCCIVFDACSAWRKVDPHQLEANGVVFTGDMTSIATSLFRTD